MKCKTVLVALLAIVLADGIARAGDAVPPLGRLAALAGETGGRAISFAVILVALLGLRSLVAFARGELARARRRAPELARARREATASSRMLRDGFLSGGAD